MGRWYLRQSELEKDSFADVTVFATTAVDGETQQDSSKAGAAALVIYLNPEFEQLRRLVAGARARLAGLETEYTKNKSRVDAVQSALFRRSREHYQKRGSAFIVAIQSPQARISGAAWKRQLNQLARP
jgi:hypothetical protein